MWVHDFDLDRLDFREMLLIDFEALVHDPSDSPYSLDLNFLSVG